MFTKPTRRRLLAASAGLVLSAGLLACGSDDSGSDDTTDHTEHTVESTATDDTAAPDATGAPVDDPTLTAQCDQYAAVSAAIGGAGDPAAAGPTLDELAANAPEMIAAETATFVEGFKAALEGSPEALDTAEFTSALGYVGGYFFDNCQLSDRLEVTGSDYAYGGLPDTIKAGRVGLRLVNISAGNEPHELVLLRRPAGDTRTADEILALPPDTLFGEYQMAGVAWTNVPSAQMSILLDIEPGAYIAICNLPTKGDEADPHANHGMVAELSAA